MRSDAGLFHQLYYFLHDGFKFELLHLNHRPRKVLGFRIPFEVFFVKAVRYTTVPSGVALLI